MADIYLSAGLYPKELDYSEYLRTKGATSAGMVAITERGVEGTNGANTPIKSWDEFKKLVGVAFSGSYGYYTAKSFYDNGGGQLFVSRVLKLDVEGNIATGKRSSVMLKSAVVDVEQAVDLLEVEALSMGKWGDNVRVEITPDARVYDSGFHLKVFVKDAGAETETLRETYSHLTLDSFNTDYAVSRVKSSYIQLKEAGDVTGKTLAKGTFALTGGNDGLTNATQEGITDADYIAAIGNFSEAPIEAIFVPGVTSRAVLEESINFCKRRGDVFPIFDSPEGMSTEAVIQFRTSSGFDTSYGAMYYPWLVVKDPTNHVKRNIPPSGAVAGIFQRGFLWEAPAGTQRAVIGGIEGATSVLTADERDKLYEAGINPIASFLDVGAVVWGQKTLQLRPTALDRINVRRTFSYLQKSLNIMIRPYVFEPNVKATWQAIIRKVSPFLQTLKDKGAIQDFKIVCDESINTTELIESNQMLVRIYVKPVKVAEYIGVEYVLSPQGVSFSEITLAA